MANLNLFQIEMQYREIAESLIELSGELTPELEKALQINKIDLETKARSYGYVILDLESEIEQIDVQIKRLSAMKSSRNKTIERLKTTVSDAMQLFEISEVKTATIKLSFRKSESVEVDSLIIDEKYCNIKTTITPDKALIKDAIKKGETVLGASIQTNYNLQIK